MNFYQRRIKLFKKRNIILIILSIIITIILCLIIPNNNYKLNNNSNYTVLLKPNTYFKNNNYDYYIANSIDNININFNYLLKRKNNINYTYNIIATIKSYAENGTKLIWTKDFNLKNTNTITNKEINIKENYNIDYAYYYNYVKSFQEYYNIKTENYLDIKLDIKINNKDNSSIIYTIPLNDNIMEITRKDYNSFINNKSNINYINIIIFIIIVIISILFIKKILNNKDILNEYQDLIIPINNKPNLSNNIIYLNNIKDLIKIALNNNLSIFNYNNEYYIIIDNIYYIYIKSKA